MVFSLYIYPAVHFRYYAVQESHQVYSEAKFKAKTRGDYWHRSCVGEIEQPGWPPPKGKRRLDWIRTLKERKRLAEESML